MIRQNRLLGYTWNPEQKKDYEDLYQSWSASDMAAEIVNLNILQSLALSREAALQERNKRLKAALQHEVDNCVNCDGEGCYKVMYPEYETGWAECQRCKPARAALAATEGAQYPRAEKETK